MPRLGLVDELHRDVAPVLLGDGISLFAGLGQRIELERLATSAFASQCRGASCAGEQKVLLRLEHVTVITPIAAEP